MKSWQVVFDVFRKLCFAAFAVVCAFYTYKLLAYHVWLIRFPWPSQSRETAMMLSTELLLKGATPYQLDIMPSCANVYGLLFNLCSCPLAWLCGPTLLVHKAMAGVFLLGCCLVLFVVLRRAGLARLYAWAGALLLYAALLMHLTPLPGPDTLGTLFFLLTIFTPWLGRYSWRSLLVSALFGLASFYTKIYFTAGVLCVASFVFLCVSPKKGFLYGCGFGVLFVCSYVVIALANDFYFYNVLWALRFNGTYEFSYLLLQLKAFCVYYRELLALLGCALVCALVRWLSGRPARAPAAPQPAWRWTELQSSPLALPLYALFFMLLVFCVMLGGHNGAWLTYLFHLVTAFLVMVVLVLIRHDKFIFLLSLPLLAAALMFGTSTFVRQPAASFKTHEDWERMQTLIGRHQNILAPSCVAPLLLAQGKHVYDDGHGEYIYPANATNTPSPRWAFACLPRVKERHAQFLAQIESDVRAKRFDLLLWNEQLSAWLLPPAAVLASTYDHKDTVRLFMPHSDFTWTIEVWEPKP